MNARLLAATSLLATAVLLTGCTGVGAMFVPKPTAITEEATVAVAGAPLDGQLGKGVPADTPLWPGAKVEESSYAKGTAIIRLSTTDTYDDVLGGVSVGFERAGWDVLADDLGQPSVDASGTSEPQTAVITATKKGREALVTVTDLGDGTVEIEILVRVIR